MAVKDLEKTNTVVLPSVLSEESFEESSIDDDTISEMLASHISIESLIVELGETPPQYSEILFNIWLNRVGRLPYDPKLNDLVYEVLKDLDTNTILNAIGEEGVRFLLRASLYPPLDDTLEETLVESMEARLLAILNWNHQDSMLELINSFEHRGYPRRKAVAAIWAHILNRVINAIGSKRERLGEN